MKHEEQTETRFPSCPSAKMRYGIRIIALLVLTVLAAGSHILLGGKTAEAGETARLGISRSPLSAPLIIASDQKYFEEEGLDITAKEYSSGKLALQGLFAGEVDVSTVAGTPIVFESFERDDFCILGTFVYSYHDIKLIARRDRGIEKASSLKGKRIGTDMGTTGQFFLSAFLVYNGLLGSEVEVTDISTNDLPAALGEDRVDAISVWEPHASKALDLLQDNAIRLPSTDIYRTTFNLVAKKNYVKSHPNTLIKILKAIDQGMTFMDKQKERSQAIVSRRLGKEEQSVAGLWDEYVYKLFLDQALLVSLADEARWAIRNRLTDRTEVPDFMELIHIDVLDSVKPGEMTIIR